MKMIATLRTLLLFCVISCSMPALASSPYQHQPKIPVDALTQNSSTLFYHIEFIDSDKGHLKITIDSPADKKGTRFHGGTKGEYDILSSSATDSNGKQLKVKTKGKYFILAKTDAARVTLVYTIKIGGLGRHGHQGYFDERFAAFDGRAYLKPANRRGITQIQVSYDTSPFPKHYKVITPWVPTNKKDTYLVYDYGKTNYLFKSLHKSLNAIGPFEKVEQKIGETHVEVYTYQDWQADYKKELVVNSQKLFEYFSSRFGYKADGPYQVLWHPYSKNKRRIWTAVWSNGMAYEQIPGNDYRLKRNWELFGHRVAHPINEYGPWGMKFKDKDEHWFLEGWATYIEHKAGHEVGIFDETGNWDNMYRRYLSNLAKQDKEMDFKLSIEKQINDGAVKEFIHYTKAPIAVKLLDHEVKTVTKGKKNLEDFIAYIYPKYSSFNGTVPLKKELAAFTGQSFEGFWNKYIRSTELILPLWRDAKSKADETNTTAQSIESQLTEVYSLSCSNQQKAVPDSLKDYAFTKHASVSALDKQTRAYMSEIPVDIKARFFADQLTAFTESEIIEKWAKESPNPAYKAGIPERSVEIFSMLDKASEVANASIDKTYLSGFQMGLKQSKSGVAVDKQRQIFRGKKGKFALNLYWNKRELKVKYRVLKDGNETYSKVRPVKLGWATTLTNFNLAPRGNKDGIYAGEGLYHVEISLADSGKVLASLPFYVVQPFGPQAINGNSKQGKLAVHEEIMSFVLHTKQSDQPSLKQAYHAIVAARLSQKKGRGLRGYGLKVLDIVEPDTKAKIYQKLQRIWAELNIDLTQYGELSKSFFNIGMTLKRLPASIDLQEIKRADLTADSYSNLTCDQTAFPLDATMTFKLNFQSKKLRQLEIKLTDSEDKIIQQKSRTVKANWTSYSISFGPVETAKPGIYWIDIKDSTTNTQLIKRPVYLF